jgi:hypothetical protein
MRFIDEAACAYNTSHLVIGARKSLRQLELQSLLCGLSPFKILIGDGNTDR